MGNPLFFRRWVFHKNEYYNILSKVGNKYILANKSVWIAITCNDIDFDDGSYEESYLFNSNFNSFRRDIILIDNSTIYDACGESYSISAEINYSIYGGYVKYIGWRDIRNIGNNNIINNIIYDVGDYYIDNDMQPYHKAEYILDNTNINLKLL